MTRLDRLTDADARILGLEAGTIRGHTCKVVVVGPREGGGTFPLAELRAHVGSRVAGFPRLRRRLAPTPLRLANPAWVDDADFDVARHVFAADVGGSTSRGGLRAIVAELMTRRLERDRPLWRIDVVGLEDGGVALVLLIHHCLADGMTAGRILAHVILDLDAAEPAPPAGESAPAPGSATMLALAVSDRFENAAGTLLRGGRSLASPAAWRGWVGTGRRLPATLRRELASGSVDSPLDAPPGPDRVVEFVSRPLDDLHRVSKAFGEGVTINDVVLAAVAGGLRCWLADQGVPVGDLRAKVPVSLHHAGEDQSAAANRDSFMVVDLGLERTDPVDRLLAISAETEDRKRHHDAEEIDALLQDLAHVSRSLERFAERWASRPGVFAVNVSNVPGPRGKLTLLGAPVREVHSLAEVANRHALRVSAFSASGVLSFGFCADAAVMANVEVLAAGVEGELDELVGRVPAA